MRSVISFILLGLFFSVLSSCMVSVSNEQQLSTNIKEFIATAYKIDGEVEVVFDHVYDGQYKMYNARITTDDFYGINVNKQIEILDCLYYDLFCPVLPYLTKNTNNALLRSFTFISNNTSYSFSDSGRLIKEQLPLP